MWVRIAGAVLASLAAVLLASGALSRGWWEGHPSVQGKAIAGRMAHLGLREYQECDTKGIGQCREISYFERDNKMWAGLGYAAFGGALGAAAVMLGLAFGLLLWPKPRVMRKVGNVGAAIAVVAAAAATGFMLLKPGSANVPRGLGSTLFFAGGGLALVAAGMISSWARRGVRRIPTNVSAPASMKVDAMSLLRGAPAPDPAYEPAPPTAKLPGKTGSAARGGRFAGLGRSRDSGPIARAPEPRRGPEVEMRVPPEKARPAQAKLSLDTPEPVTMTPDPMTPDPQTLTPLPDRRLSPSQWSEVSSLDTPAPSRATSEATDPDHEPLGAAALPPLPLIPPPPGSAAPAALPRPLPSPSRPPPTAAPAPPVVAAPRTPPKPTRPPPPPRPAPTSSFPPAAPAGGAPPPIVASPPPATPPRSAPPTRPPPPTSSFPPAAPAGGAPSTQSLPLKVPAIAPRVARAATPDPSDMSAAGPVPACPECEAPTVWIEEHLRFYCRKCKIYL